MAKRGDTKVVWSSSDGDLRKARDPQVKARLEGGGRVKVRRETAGRRGKAVTTVANVPLDDAGLKALTGRPGMGLLNLQGNVNVTDAGLKHCHE